MDGSITQLAVNRLIIVPFTVHPVLHLPVARKSRDCPSLVYCYFSSVL